MRYFIKLSLLAILILSLIPTFSLANENNKNLEVLGSDEDVYVEEIVLNADDIKKLTKNGKVIFNPQSLKNNDLYLTNYQMEIDLYPDKVKDLETEAIEYGNQWAASSIKITNKFVNEDGEFIKVKDFKKMKKDKNYILDDKSKESSTDNVIISSLVPNPEKSRSYTYMTTYIQVWDEVNTSTNKKRHYLRSNHTWNTFAYAWINTQDDDTKDDIAILAWSIGPTAYDDPSRDAYVTWKNYSGDKQIVETYGETDLHTEAGPNASAFSISDHRYQSGTYYGLEKVTLYAFTGWYDKGAIGQNGSVTGQYAHGFASDTLSFSVSVGYPSSIGVAVTPTSTSRVEIAKIWDILNTY